MDEMDAKDGDGDAKVGKIIGKQGTKKSAERQVDWWLANVNIGKFLTKSGTRVCSNVEILYCFKSNLKTKFGFH